jgi:hypothetical protein
MSELGLKAGAKFKKSRAHRRRRDRQVPPPRRQRRLRGHGAHGAGFSYRYPLSMARATGARRTIPNPSRRCATPSRGSPPMPTCCSPSSARARSTGCRTSTARSRSRHAAGAGAERAAQRHHGYRRGHGDGYSAAQPARGRAAAAIRLLEAPKTSLAELCEIVRGPDFPTAAEIITPAQDIAQIYATGRGGLRMRAVGDGARRYRGHGAAVPGLRRPRSGADCAADAGQEAADGRRSAR